MITITEQEYKYLQGRSAWLGCLEAAGVDNWQGYDYAQDYWKDISSDYEEDDQDG
jgi:hypothetical protein